MSFVLIATISYHTVFFPVGFTMNYATKYNRNDISRVKLIKILQNKLNTERGAKSARLLPS